MAFPYTNIQTFIRHCIEPHVVSLKTILRLGFKQSRTDLDTEIAALKLLLDTQLTLITTKVDNITTIPIGMICIWPVATNPADWQRADGSFNWLECNGQTISEALYPVLRSIIGPNVPDLRGLFLRGLGGNSDALGVKQGDAIRNITGTFGNMEERSSFFSGAFYPSGTSGGAGPDSGGGQNGVMDVSRVVPTANENRPTNMAMRLIMRAQ